MLDHSIATTNRLKTARKLVQSRKYVKRGQVCEPTRPADAGTVRCPRSQAGLCARGFV